MKKIDELLIWIMIFVLVIAFCIHSAMNYREIQELREQVQKTKIQVLEVQYQMMERTLPSDIQRRTLTYILEGKEE